MKIPLAAGAIAVAGSLLQAHAEVVAYWNFEPENRYEDRTGNGADGAAGTNVEIAPGSPAGDAISIGVSGGVPANVVVVTQSAFPAFGVGDFSFSFWARRENTAADSNGVDGVLDALNGTTQGFQALFLAPNASNKFRFRMDEPGPDFLLADSEASVPLDGVWRHFAVTVDRDDPEGLVIYIDGALDSRHDPTEVSDTLDHTQDFWIGCINGGGNLGLDGSLDELAFYNVVLSSEQIGNLASGKSTPLTVFTPPLPPQLRLSHDIGSLTIEWESQEGMLYNLRSVVDPSVNSPAAWPLFDPGGDGGFGDIPATPPLNTATFPLPPESQRYFAVQEYPPPPEVVFEDDFENGQGGWTQGSDSEPGTLWELGSPSNVGPPAANSLENCFATNISGEYGLDANVWLRSPPIDLTTAGGATLRYAQFHDIEAGFDAGSVSVLDAADDAVLAVIEAPVDGVSTDWEMETKIIPAEALGKTVKLEFRFTSDEISNFAGWYIDDVEVTVP